MFFRSPTTNLHLFPKGATQRVTDGYLLANASRIILATTARRFEFYHASNGRHTNTLMLPNVATCLDYYINPLNSSESDLVFGDMQGNVGHIRFSAARCSLFQSAVPDAAMDALPNGRTWLGDLPPPDRHAMEPAPATCEVFSAHQLCPTTDEVLDESVSTIRSVSLSHCLVAVSVFLAQWRLCGKFRAHCSSVWFPARESLWSDVDVFILGRRAFSPVTLRLISFTRARRRSQL